MTEPLCGQDLSRVVLIKHGRGGPLAVSDLRDRHPLAQAYVEAAVQCGYPRNDDFNGAAQEGAGFYQTTMRDGVRASTAAGYLKARDHQLGQLMGPLGVMMNQWVDVLQRPLSEAILIAVGGAVIAWACFRLAETADDPDSW